MKKDIHYILLLLCLPLGLMAQPPDQPVSPVTAVSMLDKGILFEPESGGVDLGVSAPYRPAYGDSIVAAGFRSVRIRYQGDKNPMMIAIADGPPYDAADDALLDELEGIIDDLLDKNLAVVITFYGLTDDNPGDLDKMVSWWGYVAGRFKDKSHRLIFDLFVEPWRLVNNADPQRIAVYYQEITREIRKTNPDRLIIYFKVPPQNANDNPFGPGSGWFITGDFDPIPPEAGIWHMWDFHVLKSDVRDNVRLIQQAWEYMDSAKQVVWSGAWASKTDDNEMWMAWPMAVDNTRRFIDRGIPSAYLMMFDGGTGIYDAQRDHNGNGVLEEWAWPEITKMITAGPDVWWNMLSNPGFEEGLDHWTTDGGTVTAGVSKEDHFLYITDAAATEVKISQDVGLALQNNGPGKYDFLAKITSQGNTRVRFVLTLFTGDGEQMVESEEITVTKDSARLLNIALEIPWTGDLQDAVWSVILTGDNATLDKTGFTSFYYDDPVLNTTLWPGERIHNESYSQRTTSTIDVNVLFRSILKKGVGDGDPQLAPLAQAIDTVAYDLETRLIELIGSDYQRTSAGTQYRLVGYYMGPDNLPYKKDVEYYIRKDAEASSLNAALIEKQEIARDHLILNDYDFRAFFWKVFRGWPPSVEPQIPLNQEAVAYCLTGGDGGYGDLSAVEEGAVYRWLDCDLLYNPMGGATDQSFTPEREGHYAVRITKDGFTVISNCVYPCPLAVRDGRDEPPARVRPNPSDDRVTLQFVPGRVPYRMVLLDLQGRRIKTFDHISSVTCSFALPPAPGLYLLELCYPGGKEVLKVMKK